MGYYMIEYRERSRINSSKWTRWEGYGCWSNSAANPDREEMKTAALMMATYQGQTRGVMIGLRQFRIKPGIFEELKPHKVKAKRHGRPARPTRPAAAPAE